MGKRIAVLDLGTNVFHLLIAEVEGTQIKELYKAERGVKLGEKGLNEGYITDAAFERGIKAIEEYNELLNIHGRPEIIRGAGTSAIRSSKNGSRFVNEIKQRTDIQIDIIEGDREAQLIYEGVKKAVNITETSLIMDIGGGSIEFIICNQYGILYKKSYPLGAARLMQQFQEHDPISIQEIRQLKTFIAESTNDLDAKILEYNPTKLIGSAGSFETFTAILIKENNWEPLGDNTSYNYRAKDLLQLLNNIIISNHTDRASNPLIIPVRVDMCVTAAVITEYFINKYEFTEVALSTYSLKEGLLFSLAE